MMLKNVEVKEETIAYCSHAISDCEKDSDSDRDFGAGPLMLSSVDESGQFVFELLPQDSMVQDVGQAQCAPYQENDCCSTSARQGRALVPLLAVLGLAGPVLAGPVVHQGSFDTERLRVHVAQDKGRLTIAPSTSSLLVYRAEFSRAFPGGGDPAKSKVEVDAQKKKLTVQAGTGVRAKVHVQLSSAAALGIELGEGSLEIGNCSGRIKASVANGTIDFDSSGIPEGTCVHAQAGNGSVETPWGNAAGIGAEVPCGNPWVDLRVENGSIIVR